MGTGWNSHYIFKRAIARLRPVGHYRPNRESLSLLPMRQESDFTDEALPKGHCNDAGQDRMGKRQGILVILDRKSTRLNSSHLVISYAVFCLKKKKKTQ